jgi:hypothetical protein
VQSDSYLPFFSSCESTEAASFFASDVVGFFAPESTLLARVERGGVDCFFAIIGLFFDFGDEDRVDEAVDAPH